MSRIVASGPPPRPRPPPRLALVEAAGQALLAALLVDEGRLAALLAQVADRLAPAGRRQLRRRRLDLAGVLGQDARDGVGQGEDLGGAEAHRLAAPDAAQLADD